MRIARAVLMFIASLLLTFPAAAQTQITTAVIEGVVTDASGGVLPGVNVAVKNVATNLARVLVTDGEGRFNHFQGGSVYWTPWTGGHEVHGSIRDHWAGLGWEQGFLGFPVTGEMATPDGVGRFNHFEGGSIYWTPWADSHVVHGAIRAQWAALGWERGTLGYPTSDEYAVPGGQRSTFEHGALTWIQSSGRVEVSIG